MSRRALLIALILLLVGGGLLSAFLPFGRNPQPARVLSSLPTSSGDGFSRADGPRQLQFPLDYGPHNDFQSEWWYYTGNLDGPGGQRYGYQLTFFRRALLAPSQRVQRSSDWAANQVYMAHFTLTDAASNRFQYYERLERGAAGLAGATGQPLYSVWLDDWSVRQLGANTYRLHVASASIRLDLTLKDLKGPVLEGDQGYSQKGPGAGNASYYFSQTRLDSTGSLSLNDRQVQVSGLSWMDHEFSTSALGPAEVGWDWFALQLDDGSELMVYRIRKADGSADEYSSGAYIAQDGSLHSLQLSQFSMDSQGQWKSPHSGAVYPTSWVVKVPDQGLELKITPLISDQELNVSFTYWEGAVLIEGTRNGNKVNGRGYVELTGYAHSMQGQF